MITIVDCGIGNILSVKRMLDSIGAEAIITDKPQRISDSTKIILPGVGHFNSVMHALESRDLMDVLIRKACVDQVPFLGICVGMQVLCRYSEEGQRSGLNLIDADVVKFEKNSNGNLKIPHMGWNQIDIAKQNSLLLNNEEKLRFYFVHSYYVRPDDNNIVIAKASHGKSFCAAFNSKNIYGVQFHPEKSHKFGKALFKQFVKT